MTCLLEIIAEPMPHKKAIYKVLLLVDMYDKLQTQSDYQNSVVTFVIFLEKINDYLVVKNGS